MAFRKVTTFNAYRSYQHLTRVLFAMCIILGVVSIVLTCFIINLYPLKEIQPMLLSVSDKQNQIVRVEPFERNVDGIRLMTEKLLMRYVEIRESVDGISESARYQEVAHMTDAPLWGAFWSLMKPDNPKSPLKEFQTNNIIRNVKVKRCLSLAPAAPNTYRIEWESLDMRNGEEIKRSQWITTIAIRFDPQEVKYEEQYINPLGLTVVHYAIAKKEI